MPKTDIKALLQTLAGLKTEGRSKVGELEALEAKNDRSDDETRTMEGLAARLDEIEKEIPVAQASVDKERQRLDRERAFSPLPGGQSEVLPARSIVSHEPDPARFASFGEQLSAVFNAANPASTTDPRLFSAATGLNEAVGADAGFLVQQEFSSDLIRNAHETGLLTPRVRRIPAGANANGIVIPSIDETSRADGSRWGGVRAYWDGEAEQFTASRPKFSKLELKLNKLTGLCYATDEMLQDSTALGAIISQAFNEEFGFKLDDAIFRGTGVGMPLGIMNSPAKIAVAKESGQTAATIVVANILKMWSRVPASLRANLVWLINSDAEPQLPQMTIGNQPVYLPPGGLSGQGFGSLMGRPVLPIEHCETVGTEGDFVLTNLNEYVMYEKGGVEQATSIHVRFDFGEQAFRFTLRIDGKPRWKSPLTPFKGTNTKSPFVTLATRA